jgi:hypothetical protein
MPATSFDNDRLCVALQDASPLVADRVRQPLTPTTATETTSEPNYPWADGRTVYQFAWCTCCLDLLRFLGVARRAPDGPHEAEPSTGR